MRSRLTLALAAGVAAASLVGCGAQSAPEPEESASAGECTPSGEASDSVEVSEALGAKPTAEFEAPLEVSATERTVVVEGDGEQAESGDTVQAELTLFDATSGDELISTGHDGSQTQAVTLDGMWPAGFVKALTCATVGTRVVTTISPEDGYGAGGNPQLGVAADTSLVLVADLVSIPEPPEPPLARADGESQELPEGFPAIEVKLAQDGAPTVTLPNEEPPSELRIAVLKKGTGAEVEPGANVTVHYQGIIWDTKTVFNDSWAGGSPIPFRTNEVVSGFGAMLEGQTVGSQVIAVLPPEAGYGEAGNPDAGIEGTDTLVFIVDILATS